ncbi:hypothetical protein [Streptomyces filamentosus]|uniref:hypothetical protein n=1 Tax=Streptomyces filamentosus TaxID=67294 RepID=UPI0037D67666
MVPSRARKRGAAVATVMAAALIGIGVGAGTAHAAGWPPLQRGGHLYGGTNGTGAVTEADLGDFGTCHTLADPVSSVQIVSGSASLVLYPQAGCGGSWAWASGSLAQSNLPGQALSYRVVTP